MYTASQKHAQQDLFDFEQMDDIMLGVPPELVELLGAFIQETRRDISLMREQFREGQQDEVLARLHKVKGIGASFGLRGFSASAAAAESSIKKKEHLEDSVKRLKTLGQILDRSERGLRELRPDYLPPVPGRE
jgi:HPt (histidine-containing phosphotransfer) domain-containing protein